MKQAQTGWTFHALLNALGPLVKDVDGQTGAELGEISTDSRTITSGSVFVALKGPNFDGHDYAVAAKDRGAGVLIVERNVGTRRVLPADHCDRHRGSLRCTGAGLARAVFDSAHLCRGVQR